MMFEMPPIEWYLERHGDTVSTRITYYKTYLIHTDYVASKIAECTYLGQSVEDKYRDVLQKRAEARAAIDALEDREKEDNNEPSTGNAG